VIIFGKSIGSFPAVSIASRPYYSRLRGLVLVSPVASAARCVLQTKYVPKFLLSRLDRVALDNLANMHNVQCLVLFVHGKQDTVVTCDNSEDLRLSTNYHSQYPALTNPLIASFFS
jgi:abhydrolase domain-containing protein 17